MNRLSFNYEGSESSSMDGSTGTPRLLSVEEKWQIIFNERTRAPIYAVTQYIGYLNQFVDGHSAASRDTGDVIKKDGINPISYLLRKLKLDLKMSYDSFVDEFLSRENNGMTLLVKLLKSIQNTGSKQSGSANMSQLKNYKKTLTDEHDCLLCLKYTMRSETALPLLLGITYGLETVSMGLLSTFTKSRGTAIEILTVALSEEEGVSRVLDCFTFIRLKIGEPVRFKSLMNMMNLGSKQNVIFKVSCMRFLNSLLRSANNLNTRVYLQHELETAGLDVDDIQKNTMGNGLEYDDLRSEVLEWNQNYVNVEEIMASRKSPSVIDNAANLDHQSLIEDLKTEIQILSVEKASLERQLHSVTRNVEKLKRKPKRHDAEIQCEPIATDTASVACQCDLDDPAAGNGDPLRTAAEYFGWQSGTGHPNDEEAVYYFDYRENDNPYTSHENDGVGKVDEWLRSHCETNSKCSQDVTNPCDKTATQSNYRRGKIAHRRLEQIGTASKTDSTGNWRLLPKSIEQFPSRFPEIRCHKTNCDRCDVTNRQENTPIKVVQKSDSAHKNDSKSQSSDSAIGGSGDYTRQETSNDKSVPKVTVELTEADLLQDMIQPDDSASGYQVSESHLTSEPMPDYYSTTLGHRFDPRGSYRSELSKVLNEFEGTLNKFDSLGRKKSVTYRKYIAMGDV